MNTCLQQYFTDLLKEELIPAMGCTEPIAIAYASAVAASYLKSPISHITVSCSKNILKNAHSVFVPHTNGRKGIKTAAITGAMIGDPKGKLEVLSHITDEDLKKTEPLFDSDICTVKLIESSHLLHIQVLLQTETETAMTEITDHHTHISQIVYNQKEIYKDTESGSAPAKEHPNQSFTVEDTLEFIETVPLENISALLQKQIDFNMAVAREGLTRHFGADIEKYFEMQNPDQKLKAFTAAACEARMSGCALPVIINSGSGNLGLATSVPVIVYAEETKADSESLYRALALANLLTIRQKRKIGSLSAFCNAVSGACSAAAAIAYLASGKNKNAVYHTIENALAISSGVICDGAKPSCAGKVAMALDASLLAAKMALSNQNYAAGDGIITGDVEKTIDEVAKIANNGMKNVDAELVDLFLI